MLLVEMKKRRVKVKMEELMKMKMVVVMKMRKTFSLMKKTSIAMMMGKEAMLE